MFGLLPAFSAAHPKLKPVSYEKDIVPVFQEYCYGCHGEKKKGDLDLRPYLTSISVTTNRELFAKVLKNLRAHEMPPEKKPHPSEEQRQLITTWIEGKIFPCDCNHPDPGRVTLRRLNRTEYNNTIRDLVGIDFAPAEDFPQDDVGYGFDNIGDVLSLSPLLFEKYMAAAESVLDQAITTERMPGARTNRLAATDLDGTAPGETTGEGMHRLSREGDIHTPLVFPTEGEYILRARAYGEQAGPDPARMSFEIDGHEVARFDVTVEKRDPKVYESRVAGVPGKHVFGAAYLNNYVNKNDPDPKKRDRNLVIDYLEIVTPAAITPLPLPESHRRIFAAASGLGQPEARARQILGAFARRAFRRPVKEEEVTRLTQMAQAVWADEHNFERGIQVALRAVLASPHFLFRGEWQSEPDNPKSIHPINEFALATRLSYFLWSTMPDEELFALAEHGTLRKNLEAQVKRMLKSPRSRALVDNFASQWLLLRNLKTITPDQQTFPKFDDALRNAMIRETEMFFETIMKEDRSVLEFLNADYTYVNERLARHYGIAGVTGEQFRKVSLQGTHRAGVLTHGSVLTLTSNPTRTSPVKRGKYVLDNLLGAPPPPPPPDVPELKETKLTGTLRQRMEQHRQNPLCASCHARMDPIGFGLENFDGIGEWRERDEGFPINPSGQLVTGEAFSGATDLAAMLAKNKRDAFVRCLTEKTLSYALGRGLEYFDQCALDRITEKLARNRYRFSTLILEVIKSAPFQNHRGDDAAYANN